MVGECAKGGQPEKGTSSGGRGGDALAGAVLEASAVVGITIVGGPLAVVGPEPAGLCSVRWSGAGSGEAGAVVELAEVSVVREPGWCVGCSIQFG